MAAELFTRIKPQICTMPTFYPDHWAAAVVLNAVVMVWLDLDTKTLVGLKYLLNTAGKCLNVLLKTRSFVG